MIKMLIASVACASALFAAQGDVFEGVVLESVNGGGYTYLHIEDAFKNKHWVAVTGLAIENGVEVRLTEELRTEKFESKSLNRTFDKLIFASNLQYRTKAPQEGNLALINEVVKESPYKQKDTLSIQEAIDKRNELSGKKVVVRGKVVKVSRNILERNFIHIQDGTGANGEVGRIVFTSKDDTPNVGDIVRAEGVVSVDKNFGSGYVYKIIVENAQFIK